MADRASYAGPGDHAAPDLVWAVWLFFARQALAAQYERQRQRVDDLSKRNQKMTAEVLALKQHPDAFESRARSDLGLVKPGEFFYLIPDEEP